MSDGAMYLVTVKTETSEINVTFTADRAKAGLVFEATSRVTK